MLRHLILIISLLWGAVAHAAIIGGNTHGSVTMEVIYDYQCPHCHAMYPVIQSLIAHNPEVKVRWMPVAILNELSIEQAATAIAASQYNNSFGLYNNAALTGTVLNQSDNQNLMSNLGLNNEHFLSSRHTSWIEEMLDQDFARLQQFNVDAVPLIVIYSTKYSQAITVFDGEQSYQSLQEAIIHASQA